MEEFRLGSRILQPHRQLLADGERISVGKRALDILSVLAKADGEIVTKDELLEAVWPGVTVEENALQVHVVALRKALGPEAERLVTVRGIGYRLFIGDEAPAKLEGTPEQPHESAAVEQRLPRLANAGERKDSPSWIIHRRRIALVAIAVLGVLVATWALVGADFSSRNDVRVPLVVRSLVASGSGDSTEAALASGITDELIVRLRRIPELQVATARADGSPPSAAFSQAHVLDGNIRSDGEQLRVTVRLADAHGEILWSQTFERKKADLFDVQEQIASAIANTLSVSLDVGVRSIAYGGTNNPEAYAAYIQGLIHLLDFDQSVPQRHLERAIQLDPDFIQAHANLAITYGNRIYFSANEAEANRMLNEMDVASARALELNKDLWIGSAARGWFELTRKNLVGAERRMRRVAELDQGNDPQLKDALSQYWLTTGRAKKALAYDQAKTSIDPIYDLSGRATFVLMMNGRHDEASDLFERLSSAGMAGLEAYTFHIFWARMLAGDEAGAYEFARGLNMPNITAAADQVRSFDSSEWSGKSLPELRLWATTTYGHGGQFQIGNLAFAAAYRGQDKLAVDLLRVAFERPGGYGLFYLWYPVLADARKTDAFEELVADLGFVEVWRASGDWGDFCRPAAASGITCS